MQRPASVTVFGVLNIVFAALGVMGIMASLAMFAVSSDSNNPVLNIVHENAAYATWLKVSIVLGFFSAVALLASGIGLLYLKPWARVLSIAYGVYAIVFGFLGIVMNFIFLVRPMLEQARGQHGPESAAALGGAIGGSIGGCLGLIYPVLLLIFMCMPKVAAAFRPSLPSQSWKQP